MTRDGRRKENQAHQYDQMRNFWFIRNKFDVFQQFIAETADEPNPQSDRAGVKKDLSLHFIETLQVLFVRDDHAEANAEVHEDTEDGWQSRKVPDEFRTKSGQRGGRNPGKCPVPEARGVSGGVRRPLVGPCF